MKGLLSSYILYYTNNKMGIRGLTGFLRWIASSNPSIADSSIDWSKWKHKKIGIDILGFLYRAKSQRHSIFTFLGKFIAACKKHEITPVMVFDGKPPDEKRILLQKRAALRLASEETKRQLEKDLGEVPMNEIQTAVVTKELQRLDLNSTYLTSEERDMAKQLFYACGIVSLNASCEADSVLAHFSKRDEFAAVISHDFDLLARGVETLLVPENYALPGDAYGWSEYNLPTILRQIRFTYDQFLDMCVLMGCDYTSGLMSLPFKRAYWMVQFRGSLPTLLDILGVPDPKPYETAKQLLEGLLDTQESLMGEKQWEKWRAGPPPIECDVLDTFHSLYLDSLTTNEFAFLKGEPVLPPLALLSSPTLLL